MEGRFQVGAVWEGDRSAAAAALLDRPLSFLLFPCPFFGDLSFAAASALVYARSGAVPSPLSVSLSLSLPLHGVHTKVGCGLIKGGRLAVPSALSWVVNILSLAAFTEMNN